MSHSMINDDYATCHAGRYDFYVGYEETVCPKHGNNSDCDCYEKDPAFVASENGKEVARCSIFRLISDTTNGVHDMSEYLLEGIGAFGKKFWKDGTIYATAISEIQKGDMVVLKAT